MRTIAASQPPKPHPKPIPPAEPLPMPSPDPPPTNPIPLSHRQSVDVWPTSGVIGVAIEDM
ncbi:MAG TPA: hypothetical protein VJM31_09560 [Vicinamibacterales bacterium]|nr:hypothetical protein [Vicinamibacterales bacterium]